MDDESKLPVPPPAPMIMNHLAQTAPAVDVHDRHLGGTLRGHLKDAVHELKRQHSRKKSGS